MNHLIAKFEVRVDRNGQSSGARHDLRHDHTPDPPAPLDIKKRRPFRIGPPDDGMLLACQSLRYTDHLESDAVRRTYLTL